MLWISVFWFLRSLDVFVGVHVRVMRKTRGNLQYLYSKLESSPGRNRNMERPIMFPRLAKDLQGCVRCFAFLHCGQE